MGVKHEKGISIYKGIEGDIVETEKLGTQHLSAAIILQLITDAMMTPEQTSTSYLKQCKASAINYFFTDYGHSKESREYLLSVGLGVADPEKKVEKIREVIKSGDLSFIRRRRTRNKKTGKLGYEPKDK